MFSSQKRIFAGKTNLLSEPFCPYLTNVSGHQSLMRQHGNASYHPGGSPHARPSISDGKRHA